MIFGGLLVAHIIIVGGGIVARAFVHSRALRRLPKSTPSYTDWPSIVVFVPARNEEGAIGACLESLLGQDYPGRFAIVAANDHSEDATGRIMHAMAAHAPTGRLTAFDVPDLPPGWMGKNHALHHAVQRAPFSPDLCLFTDADILYEPSMLRRAVHVFRESKADHLFAIPALISVSFWERCIMPTAGMMMMAGVNPRRIEKPGKRHFMGVGAFNLIRRTLYEEFGGHAAIRGEVLDDVALGMKTKEHGRELRCVLAGTALRVRMYTGLGSIVTGFTKNFHAAIGGSFARSIFIALMIVFMGIAPTIVFAANLVRGDSLAAMLALTWHFAYGIAVARLGGPPIGGSRWPTVFCHPFAFFTLAYVTIRSGWISAVQGEIHWRGRQLQRPKQQVRMQL